MNKIKVDEVVFETSFFDGDENSIQDFLSDINDATQKGATKIRLETENDSYTVNMTMYFERDETDEEYKQRIYEIEYRQKREIEYKRLEYERLKNFFEPKTK